MVWNCLIAGVIIRKQYQYYNFTVNTIVSPS